MDAKTEPNRDINPVENANFLSKITFWFVFHIFQRGRKNFNESEVYAVIKGFKAKILGDQLEDVWELEKDKKNPSLLKALFKVFGFQYICWGILCMLINTSMMFIKPALIGKIVGYFSVNQSMITKENALSYAALLITCIFTTTLFSRTYVFSIEKIALKVKIACSSLIYRKMLKTAKGLSNIQTSGQAVTLMTKDVLAFDTALIMIQNLFTGIAQVLAMTYVMYVQLGIAGFAGVAAICIFVPVQALLGVNTTRFRLATAQKTDERIRLTQEILLAIKIIKMYTWELIFGKSIAAVRKKEIKVYQKVVFLRAMCISIGVLTGKLALYTSIVAFVALGNHITPEKAFVVTACFSSLRTVIAVQIPVSFVRTGEIRATLKRLHNYLLSNETPQESIVKYIDAQTPSIELKHVSVYHENSILLENIDVSIKPGITIILGPIGSGKSVFLKTFLGDIPAKGNIEVSGNISYASQEPWLFPGTVKQNIIFNEPFNKVRYNTVVKVCALEKDFDALPLGDDTVVIDRGLNLSKGQQTRINLARAIYKPAGIYLLDDCLSAVDLEVGKYIFYKCLKKFLNDKVCVLVTHHHSYLQDANNILVLSNGHLKFQGSFDKLLESDTDNHFDKKAKIDETLVLSVINNEQVYNGDLQDIDETSTLLNDSTTSPKNIYQENNQDGKINKKVYQKYFIAGGLKLLLFAVVLVVARQVSESWSDHFVRFWVESEQKLSILKLQNMTNTTKYEEAYSAHNQIMYQYSIVILSLSVLSLLSAVVFFTFTSLASIHLHRLLIDKIMNAAMEFFDHNLAGNIINRFSRDFSVVDEYLPFSIFECFKATLTVIAILLVVSSVNTLFLITSAIFTILLFFGCRLYLTSGRNIRRIEGATKSPVIGHMQATLDGLCTIRASRASEAVKDEFDSRLDVYSSAQFMTLAYMHGFAFYMDIFSNLYVAVIVFSLLLFNHNTGAGKVGLAITQSFVLTTLIQWCLRQWSELELKMTSAERLLEYIKVKPEDKSGDHVKDWPKEGKIVYNNVFLRYSKTSSLVLNNINFTIAPKEKVGIVGRTGAGKSSIISTLFRLYPFNGRITIDDIDINTVKIDELRSKMSIIPQDPILFSGTIRTNIDPFNKYSDKQLWRALDQVKMNDTIDSLDTKVVEGGTSFSIGQKQLICLARAVVQNSLIIILDEATANVDVQTDALIQKTIKHVFSDRTIIIIAHKLNTILDCHKVLVIDSGAVVEYGIPKILFNDQNGVFHRMVKKAGISTNSFSLLK